MTVADLVIALKDMPQDAEVQIDDRDYGFVSIDRVYLSESANFVVID